MEIVVAILMFSFIVLFHELGHFLFAKKNGVGVLEFSIGMGPKLISVKKKETMYSIRLIPFGGYVAMEGEIDEEEDTEEEAEELSVESLYPSKELYEEETEGEDNSSEEQVLSAETNDEDKKISETSFTSKTIWQRLQVMAAGPIFNIILTIILLIPVLFYIGTPTTKLRTVTENTPAYEAQLREGDIIEVINGQNIDSWRDATEAINANGGKTMSMTVDRNGKEMSFIITPEKSEDGVYRIGIQSYMEKDFLEAVKGAFVGTYNMSVQMIEFVGQLFTGNLPMKFTDAVSGPVGVVSIVSDASEAGLINVVYVMAIISLNLGILNLLPVPALDGFKILMLFIEFIRGGKKLDPKKEGMINFVGFALLMGLIVFVTFNDITKLLK